MSLKVRRGTNVPAECSICIANVPNTHFLTQDEVAEFLFHRGCIGIVNIELADDCLFIDFENAGLALEAIACVDNSLFKDHIVKAVLARRHSPESFWPTDGMEAPSSIIDTMGGSGFYRESQHLPPPQQQTPPRQKPSRRRPVVPHGARRDRHWPDAHFDSNGQPIPLRDLPPISTYKNNLAPHRDASNDVRRPPPKFQPSFSRPYDRPRNGRDRPSTVSSKPSLPKHTSKSADSRASDRKRRSRTSPRSDVKRHKPESPPSRSSQAQFTNSTTNKSDTKSTVTKQPVEKMTAEEKSTKMKSDHNMAYGRLIADRLNKMSDKQQALARVKIEEALFSAEYGELESVAPVPAPTSSFAPPQPSMSGPPNPSGKLFPPYHHASSLMPSSANMQRW